MSKVLPIVLVVVGLGQGGDPGAVRSVIDAERAFARMSVEVNQRDAFLAFFAPDGVHFQPEPGNAREALAARAAPVRPKARVLDWEPAFVAMAESGDLGFSTGPFTLANVEAGGTVLGEGWFFSLWKRQPDGAWRVAADIGIPAPGSGPLRPREPVVLAAHAPSQVSRPAGERATGPGVPQVERQFCAELEGKLPAESYAAWSGPDTRVYRAGRQPIVGVKAIREALEGASASQWHPVGGGASTDLAYAFKGRGKRAPRPRRAGPPSAATCGCGGGRPAGGGWRPT